MEEMPDIFTTFDISWTLLAIIVWTGVVVLYIIFSLILVYHWRAYAMDRRVVQRTLRAYFLTTGTLLLLATGSLFFFI